MQPIGLHVGMILFYFPFIRYVRFGLLALILMSLVLSGYWCLCLYRALLPVPPLQPIAAAPATTPVVSPVRQLLRLARDTACEIKQSSSGITLIGSAAQIIQCSWLCGVYDIPIQSYILTPRALSGRYLWRVVV
ncbi:MAG: hypothetical protein QG604_610 [Candidatus Dependentiae bacterium]|nr:hypothetical protein [Candidatus Dependentiae bacterium]